MRVLKAADSSDLLYDVKFAGTIKDTKARVVISCGEDGLLRGWDVEIGRVIMSVPQPVTSVWSLAVLPHSGDLITANSDGKLRIFTQRIASPNVEQQGDSIGQVTKADLEEHERLCEEVRGKRARR